MTLETTIEVETPIDVGALYEYTTEQPGLQARIIHMWVDEDVQTQIDLCHSVGNTVTDEYDTVKLADFVEKIDNGDLVRRNSDHEAWRWRAEE